MKTFFNHLHAQHQGQYEMFRGALVPCHEVPARADHVLAEWQRRKLGEVCAPQAFDANALTSIHSERYLAFLESAWSEWVALDPANAARDALPSVWPTRTFRSDVLPDNFAARMGLFSFDAGSPLTSGTWVAARAGAECALSAAQALVDGEKAAENTTEPFTRFNWNLRTYVASGEHSLKVEVEDSLGLSQMSSSLPVQVTVVQPPGGIPGLILRNSTAITITFMVLAGAVVLGIIILSGRRGLASLSERQKSQRKKVDPVTQPVNVEVEAPKAGRANPFPWLRRRDPPAPAYLARLADDGSPLAGADPISLPGRESTFGSDPTQSTVVLDHPSLSLLHARLRREPDGSYRLLDENSVAGTWVNFTLIPREGQILQHGDMINFGSLTYRFVLAKAPAPRKPTVTPIQDNDTH